jgi:hypothetical protein
MTTTYYQWETLQRARLPRATRPEDWAGKAQYIDIITTGGAEMTLVISPPSPSAFGLKFAKVEDNIFLFDGEELLGRVVRQRVAVPERARRKYRLP